MHREDSCLYDYKKMPTEVGNNCGDDELEVLCHHQLYYVILLLNTLIYLRCAFVPRKMKKTLIQEFLFFNDVFNMMKFVSKIIALILFQIAILITSFLISAYLESRDILAGHVINIAGKNRVLASQVEVERYHLVLINNLQDQEYGSRHISVFPESYDDNMYAKYDIFECLRLLEANILLLKHGGNESGTDIPKLPQHLEKDWQNVADTFDEYHDMIVELSTKQNITARQLVDIEFVEDEMINYSNILTEKLSLELEQSIFQHVILQISLGIGNVVTHVILIWQILRIFNKHAKDNLEQERFVILGEFVAGLAHDMRTPMSTIYNSINLISRNARDQRSQMEIKRINRSIKRMSNQIDTVINYVKTPSLDLESHSLMEILNSCIRDLRIPDNVTLNLPERDSVIFCDSKKIDFVFTNLILNAVQALAGNRGHVIVYVKEDLLDRTTVAVENSGRDISDEDISKIFEPLYTTKLHGTGLGLTSCKNIIDAHNGTITVSNNPVTFTISLPKYDTTAL